VCDRERKKKISETLPINTKALYLVSFFSSFYFTVILYNTIKEKYGIINARPGRKKFLRIFAFSYLNLYGQNQHSDISVKVFSDHI